MLFTDILLLSCEWCNEIEIFNGFNLSIFYFFVSAKYFDWISLSRLLWTAKMDLSFDIFPKKEIQICNSSCGVTLLSSFLHLMSKLFNPYIFSWFMLHIKVTDFVKMEKSQLYFVTFGYGVLGCINALIMHIVSNNNFINSSLNIALCMLWKVSLLVFKYLLPQQGLPDFCLLHIFFITGSSVKSDIK